MKIALVYQTGIANVFRVDAFTNYLQERNAVRLLQHAFSPCEYFARGLLEGGHTIKVFSCNQAGDIINADWTAGLDDCPFRDKANPLPMLDRERMV